MDGGPAAAMTALPSRLSFRRIISDGIPQRRDSYDAVLQHPQFDDGFRNAALGPLPMIGEDPDIFGGNPDNGMGLPDRAKAANRIWFRQLTC
jgi:hypothetical protein